MRIGIVNDMGLAREALRRVVLSSPANEVAWMANDGAEAVALARADAPDLILMDLFMPGTDGVEATRRIMGESPCAILVVTATITGHLSKVYQAMGYGALDAIDTPTLGPRGEITGAALLLHKIEIIGKLLGKPAEQPGERATGGSSSSFARAPFSDRDGARSAGRPGSLDRRSASLGRGSRPASRHARGQRSSSSSTSTRHLLPGWGSGSPSKQAGRVTLVAEGHQPAAGDVLLSGTDDHLVLGEDRRLHYSARAQGELLPPIGRRVLQQRGPELAQARVSRCS